MTLPKEIGSGTHSTHEIILVRGESKSICAACLCMLSPNGARMCPWFPSAGVFIDPSGVPPARHRLRLFALTPSVTSLLIPFPNVCLCCPLPSPTSCALELCDRSRSLRTAALYEYNTWLVLVTSKYVYSYLNVAYVLCTMYYV